MVPKYDGNKKVIQQGANRATIPPKKEAVKDTPKIRFGFIVQSTFALTVKVS